MAFKFFTIPIHDSEASEADLNAFLRSHKILSVDRRWVDQGPNSYWSFCVDYLDASSGTSGSRQQKERGKIDFREVLSPEDFAVFAKLRELRKEIAQVEAVPVYSKYSLNPFVVTRFIGSGPAGVVKNRMNAVTTNWSHGFGECLRQDSRNSFSTCTYRRTLAGS